MQIISKEFSIFIAKSLNRIQTWPKLLIRIKYSICFLIKRRVFLNLNNLKYLSILTKTITPLLSPQKDVPFILNDDFGINKILRHFNLLEFLILKNKHEFSPHFIGNFVSKSFFDSTLDCSLTGKHFIIFQTKQNPVDALN